MQMKKIPFLIIFVVLYLFCNTLEAQKLTLGSKAGLSFPWLTGGTSNNPTFDSNSFKSGGEFGIYGEFHLSEKLSYSMGIEYSLQGGLNKFQAYPTPSSLVTTGFGPYLYSDFKSEINLNYLLVPILIRQSWKINQKYRIYAGAGPLFGLLLNANRTITSGSIYLDKEKTDLTSITLQTLESTGTQKLNAYNVGLNGILGLSCKLNSKEAIFIEIGAANTFLPMQENSSNGKSQTFSEMVTVGYAFTYKQHYKNRYHRFYRNLPNISSTP